jgi:transcriptional activator SPT8
MSDIPIPEVSETIPEFSDTFSTNNAARPRATGSLANGFDRNASGDEEDAVGSPDSLFGENDQGSLFGEDNAGGGGNTFDDDLTQALANGLQETDQDAPGEEVDIEMSAISAGGPVQPPAPQEPTAAASATEDADEHIFDDPFAEPPQTNGEPAPSQAAHTDPIAPLTNGLPHSDEPLTAPPTNETLSATDLPPQSESTFLSAAIDGSFRIWDRRISNPIATITVQGGTPPWCTGACWSPDGNFFYAGRRNNTVEEYSIHKLGSMRNVPNRQFKFQAGSGPVYAVRAMPNGRHLVCASQDILRIYDLRHEEAAAGRARGAAATPFTIVPGHRGGVISTVYVDPACRFMLSAAGNRGWEGAGTEVLLGYEIGVQDENGVWHSVNGTE